MADPAGRIAAVREQFADRTSQTDTLDGLTIDLADGGWLNVRASNTEPLLRLNVEARRREAMAAIRDEALAVIRSDGEQDDDGFGRAAARSWPARAPITPPLRLVTGADGSTELVCTFCASRFPVRDGIPVLLADDAIPGPNGLGVAATEPEPSG